VAIAGSDLPPSGRPRIHIVARKGSYPSGRFIWNRGRDLNLAWDGNPVRDRTRPKEERPEPPHLKGSATRGNDDWLPR